MSDIEETTKPSTAIDDAPEEKSTSSFVMIATLGVAGLLAGLLLVVVDGITAPRIAKYRKQQQELAAKEVLGGEGRILRIEKFAFVDGSLVPITVDDTGQESPSTDSPIFRGYDANNVLLGYAFPGAEFGYADVIPIVIGYSPSTHSLLGMKVLGNKETPGLGDNIVNDEHFANQWPGKTAPLVQMKGNASLANEVDTISGATISSSAVIRGMNRAIELYKPAIDALESSDSQAAVSATKSEKEAG